MDPNRQILASLIAKNDIILVGYNLYNSDTTMKFLEDSIKTIKKGTSSLIPSEGYNFAYLNENSITYALLTTKSFNKATVVGFIESIKKAFDTYFPQKDFKNVAKYGLNEQFREKLIEKMNLFNSNPDSSSEEIIQEKEKLTKQRDEILMNSNNYNDYNIEEKYSKACDLSKPSTNYLKQQEKLKRKKCLIF